MRLEMAASSNVEGWAELPIGNQNSMLLVNEDPRELAYYHDTLQKLGCRVRACSTFAEGVQCLASERFDLIMVDQGSGGFEGQKVLAEAMEIDTELRVMVLARSYDKSCHLEALRSGALDYLEGQLSAADLLALLDTFTPRRPLGHATPLGRDKWESPGNKCIAGVKRN